MADYTHKNVLEVENVAERFGYGELQESRFAHRDFETEQTGFSLHRIKPGKRQPFAHKHDEAEEIYFVVAGSGRIKIEDEVRELRPFDAVRLSAGVFRSLEAGAEGLDVLAFGPRRADDRGELVQGWWTDD